MALTPEQELEKIKTERTFAGGTFFGRTPGGIVSLTTGEIITGADLVPINLPDLPTPQLTPPTDISTLTPAPFKEELTKQEEKQVSLGQRLEEITARLAEKPAFELEKRREFGVAESQQALDDLNTRIRDLQRQQQLVPEALELESLGRGRTVGGVRPLEIGRRRAIAVEALTTASLVDAAQGRLTSAQRKVEQAVDEKFASFEAEEKALIAQIQIIKNSPETSLQERKRATAIETQRQKELARIQKIKDEEKNILEWANKAAADLAKEGRSSPEMNQKILEIQMVKTSTEARQKYLDLVARFPEIGRAEEAQIVDLINQGIIDAADIFTRLGGKISIKKINEVLGTRPAGDIGEFQRIYGRKPTADELFEFQRKQAEMKRAPKEATQTEKDLKNYTSITIPQKIKQDLISTLTDKEGAKTLGRELTLIDLITLFPEVEKDTLKDYMNEFYDYESLIAEKEITAKKWWEFWK